MPYHRSHHTPQVEIQVLTRLGYVLGHDLSGNVTEVYNTLEDQAFVHQESLEPQVLAELLEAGYLSTPSEDEKSYADAGYLVNNYFDVHPQAIIAGSKDAQYEVLITTPGKVPITLGYIRCADVRMRETTEHGPLETHITMFSDILGEGGHHKAQIGSVNLVGGNYCAS